MAMLIYQPADSTLAERIQGDLAALDSPPHITLLLLSPPALTDPEMQRKMNAAISAGEHIIPVLAQITPLPKLIEHLEPLDFSEGYDADLLATRLAEEAASVQMKVRTPQVIAANRRIGIIFAGVAIVVFLIGLYAVGVLGIQAPAAEYAAIDTEVFMTVEGIVNAALPHSTEEAAHFEATYARAAPSLQPILAATASAIAGS